MNNKKIGFLVALLLMTMTVFGQTYQELWKQVEQARNKDLPQTAMEHLQKIEQKARKAGDYGQLLKASLLTSRLQAEVAPDSLLPAVKRLEQEMENTQDVALKAVYSTVLSQVYQENARQLGEDAANKADAYRQQALQHPDALAKVKAGAGRMAVDA